MQHWIEPITLAYLDPGTGSYALQLLMAGLFGGMFALRQTWGGLRARVSWRLAAGRAGDQTAVPGRGEAAAGMIRVNPA